MAWWHHAEVYELPTPQLKCAELRSFLVYFIRTQGETPVEVGSPKASTFQNKLVLPGYFWGSHRWGLMNGTWRQDTLFPRWLPFHFGVCPWQKFHLKTDHPDKAFSRASKLPACPGGQSAEPGTATCCSFAYFCGDLQPPWSTLFHPYACRPHLIRTARGTSSLTGSFSYAPPFCSRVSLGWSWVCPPLTFFPVTPLPQGWSHTQVCAITSGSCLVF